MVHIIVSVGVRGWGSGLAQIFSDGIKTEWRVFAMYKQKGYRVVV